MVRSRLSRQRGHRNSQSRASTGVPPVSPGSAGLAGDSLNCFQSCDGLAVGSQGQTQRAGSLVPGRLLFLAQSGIRVVHGTAKATVG